MNRDELYNKQRDKFVFFFDIDGTITKETEGWDYQNRTPEFEVIAKVNDMFLSGVYEIVYWSSRLEIDREVTEKWFIQNNVMYHKLILGKPFFDMYICDKAVNVQSFKELLK